jgi:glycosyltransferase involved in cell wall biosynthesis
MPAIAVLVSNDLEFDQRVAKVCGWLHEHGYEVTLIGRLLPGSTPFSRPYRTVRFRLPFARGAGFYAFLNIRLFLFLLFHRTDVILANDLDTLPAGWLAARIRRRRIVYDSHEYFTEAEGLTGRPFQKKVWEAIERFLFPRVHDVSTVNASIAGIYSRRYHRQVRIIRNVPPLDPIAEGKSRTELGLPEDGHILILQGAFIDPDRGGIELVEAMQELSGCLLLIIGSGRDMPAIASRIGALQLNDRIRLLPRLPFRELRQYTVHASIGFSLDKPVHLNYTYSLPNKLFDYIHAGVPVLVSDLPELRRIVDTYRVGCILPEITPRAISDAVTQMLRSDEYPEWKRNTLKARESLNWQRESEVLRELFPAPSTGKFR